MLGAPTIEKAGKTESLEEQTSLARRKMSTSAKLPVSTSPKSSVPQSPSESLTKTTIIGGKTGPPVVRNEGRETISPELRYKLKTDLIGSPSSKERP